MKKDHIAPKTRPQLDKLHAYIGSMTPFNPTTREMAAHMQCGQNQIMRYLIYLERLGRIVKDAKGRVAPMPQQLTDMEAGWRKRMSDPGIQVSYKRYREIMDKIIQEHPEFSIFAVRISKED